MCSDAQSSSTNASTDEPVPDFSVVGFGSSTTNPLAEAHAQLQDLTALQLQVCVSASYNPTTNKICFTVPIYGHLCITPPIKVPVGATLKACAQTCGIIPHGLKVTIYLNNTVIYSGTVVGRC
jgi:hypothetical protein